jgi:hypothetical protein
MLRGNSILPVIYGTIYCSLRAAVLLRTRIPLNFAMQDGPLFTQFLELAAPTMRHKTPREEQSTFHFIWSRLFAAISLNKPKICQCTTSTTEFDVDNFAISTAPSRSVAISASENRFCWCIPRASPACSTCTTALQRRGSTKG